MKRSHLRSKYLNRSESNRLTFSKQRNYCVNLLRKTKGDLWNYENLNEKGIVDNKNFGKNNRTPVIQQDKTFWKDLLSWR